MCFDHGWGYSTNIMDHQLQGLIKEKLHLDQKTIESIFIAVHNYNDTPMYRFKYPFGKIIKIIQSAYPSLPTKEIMKYCSPFLHRDMPSEIFHKALDFARISKRIALAGSGEPLLTTNFSEKLHEISRVAPTAEISLLTNGLLLTTRKYVEDIMSSLSLLTISINGVSTYEKIMPPARFEGILNNLEIIKTVKQKLKKPPQTCLNFVIVKDNICDIVRITEVAIKFKFDRLLFSWQHFDIKEQNVQAIPDGSAQMKQVLLLLEQAELLALKNNLQIIYSEHRPLLQKKDPPAAAPTTSKKSAEQPIVCKKPWQEVTISSAGKVQLCCVKATIIGTLETGDFESIWQGEEANQYRQGILTGNYHNVCKTCHFVGRHTDNFIRSSTNK
jgi:MoaA/NifB/PqqE/SkfB family radical SAM enzyme